ncbi:hypothetical protein H2201_004777 [Coniosporium apollinis]|uniref:RING-type domain-containing protein n=1 Tax=Coniosporium apollinis TaxID=61459 RepID=A0ABQ9NRS2_9PEZI|nr:hypothetical protein H2201_004777 [Coniosporium apollinis]
MSDLHAHDHSSSPLSVAMEDHNALSLSVSPSEIIFSCSICQATPSDIYKNVHNSRGIRDGRSPEAQIATRLWLTECAHLTCGEHLEGGGAPFHPEGEQPRAPCPLCVVEKNDGRPKSLYGIRGTQEGSYDEAIPGSWFESPPVRLDRNGAGMEALRVSNTQCSATWLKRLTDMQFQYLQLIRFSTKILQKSRQATQTQAEAERTIEDLLSSHQTLEDRVKELKSRVKALERSEAKLRHWEEREPAIRHYLGVVSAIAKENDSLKAQLVALGYEVPKTNYSLKLADDRHLLNASRAGEKQQPAPPERSQVHEVSQTPGVRQNDRSSNNQDRSSESHETTSSGRKRKLQEFTEQNYLEAKRPKSSRDLMPPPSLPITRKSNAPPHSREQNRESTGGHRPSLGSNRSHSNGSRNGKPDLQIYENGSWQSANRRSQLEEGVSQIRLSSGMEEPTSAYMSGALPTAPSRRPTPREVASRGVESSRGVQPPFKPLTQTRASTDHRTQRDDMPFLKPLNRGPGTTDMQSHAHSPGYSQQQALKENLQQTLPDVAMDNRYAYDGAPHMPLEQYPSSSMKRETYDRTAMNKYPHQQGPTEPAYSAHFPSSSRTIQMSDIPVTPAPQRRLYSAGVSRQDSVASPFFRNTTSNFHSNNSRQPSQVLNASHPGTVQQIAHSYRMAPVAPLDWREPRSINGLSFITSPHNMNNEPIYRREAPAYNDHHTLQPFLMSPMPRNEAGLFRRPDVPPANAYTQNQPYAFAAPLPTMSNSYVRQVAPLPSGLPPAVSYHRGSSTARGFARDDVLSIKGARSGPAGLPHRGSDTHRGDFVTRDPGYSGSRGLFSSTGGRRSIRR